MTKVIFLQNVIYIVSTLGILVGADLLLGAKITANLNKMLDKTVVDFDKIITNAFSNIRKTVDSSIYIDDKIIKTNSKRGIGFLFIVICAVLIYLARRA